MKLKAAKLVMTEDGNPSIVSNDSINPQLLASVDRIGWLVVNGRMDAIILELIDEMLAGPFSIEMTANDEVKLFQNKVIIHR